jgi:Na+/proline symporter
VVVFQFLFFLTIGTGLHAYYHGASFPSGDVIFPRFIVEVMPSGLSGLLVAATLAATMGTLSSSLNSLAAVTTYDLYLPLSGRSREDPGLTKVGKRLTLAWSVVMIGGALLFRDEKTPAVALAISIASFTYGPLLGAFLLAIWDRRARERDAVIAMVLGLCAMAAIIPLGHVAWTWFVPLGTLLTFLSGGILARL